MMPRYTHLLALVALGMLMASGPAFAQTDYDTDGDNYIEVAGHAQLNAIRYDLNGDGAVAATDTANYNAAFPNAATGMGCAATCVGYELTANINLDTDGGGSANSADTYWNSGQGWSPIGSDANAASRYTGDFKGNGYAVQNLFISRNTVSYQGLFGGTGANSRIESLGVTDAAVTADDFSGILTGSNRGEIVACYTTGSITGDNVVGGLVGWTGGSISTSYSRASVSATQKLGGLVGSKDAAGSITNSYSTGAVSLSSGSMTSIGGLLGEAVSGTGTVSGSYWNTTTSGRTTSFGGSGAIGRNTTQLQGPTTYGATSSDAYYGWNIDLDNADGDSDTATGKDDPWDFAGSSAYPTLIYHLTDYDTDEDGYIEIANLAQLNAIRQDLGGNGHPASVGTAAYGTAFPNRVTTASKVMGCPSGACTGYELVADLDFDSDSDGDVDANDHSGFYWNSGAGWLPIGVDNPPSDRFVTTLKGNGHTINNLLINRSGNNQGLFAAVGSGARIEALGITNASVTASDYIGILTANNYGEIVACYTTGTISATDFIGGLAGFMSGGASTFIHSSHSTASVTSTTSSTNVAGLVGRIATGSVTNSYAIGAVSTGGGGLIGSNNSGTVTASYWDTTTSGRATSALGTGYATADLKAPTDYTAGSIYADWNANIDGQTGNDDPWDFGNSRQYPSLKYGGLDLSKQGAGDYDSDNDRLIDVSNLAQLNAMRHDKRGGGNPESGGAATYNAAFPNRDTRSGNRMGCPSNCAGYELVADLDFDSDGDGDVDANDHGGAYWNSGAGWQAIGSIGSTNSWRTTFKGNGHTINNLFINTTGGDQGLFASLWHGSGRIEQLGITNANITTTGDYAGILVGTNNGDIVGCYVTGKISGDEYVGGLVGYLERNLRSSYSHASVTGTNRVGGLVGHVHQSGPRIYNSYSTGRVTGNSNVGGLVGNLGGSATTGNTINSHWDTQTSGQSGSRGGTGKTTREFLSPTTYGATTSDTYYNWNNASQGGAGTDPWTFGTMLQYPTLKFAGMDTTVQFQVQPVIVMATLTPPTVSENGGMSTVTATLTRSRTEATTITVRPVTATYTVGADSTITIASGQTANASDTVVITAVDNTVDEADRNVNLSVISSAQGQGIAVLPPVITLIDDDAPPRLLISSPSVTEDNNLMFTVELNAVSDKEVTVAYADAGTGTATSGTDYTALTAGTLTFASGTTSQTIAVTVTGDSDDEPNETVVVTLSNAVNATLNGGATSLTGTGTIIDNDGMPALSIGSPSVIEGATGATLTFQVYLSPAHTSQVTVAYADAGTGSATSGTDYTALAGGTLTFAIGATTQTFDVSVLDDSMDEPNETVAVRLSNPNGAIFYGSAATLTGMGTIIDDDAAVLRIDSPSVAEGAAGTTSTLRFTVSLSSVSLSQVTVAYADAGTGSATSGTDYTVLAAGTLTFAVGETSKTIDVSVSGDAAVEPDETVVVRLSNAVNAALAVVTGTGTITNDDQAPTDPSEPEPEPDKEPTFTEAVDPQSYRQNQAIEPLTLPEATDGDGDLTYTLTELPEGLTFDAETRTVSGTPTAAIEKAIYTLTATDEDGDEATLSFFLTIVGNVAPSFGDASVAAQAYTRKQEITSLTLPQATGGDDPLTYALTPDLPEGLSFNAETRVLSGTPIKAIAKTTYTLTATDSDGDKATLMFAIAVMTDPIPTFGDTTVAAQVYVQHREITALTLPQATGGDDPLTYALTPALPEGLTFDAETLTVSGTPTKAMDETTYTLTATDGNGDSAPLMFTLEVPDLVPTFGDTTTIASQSYLVNQEIASLTLPQATGGDGMLVYILLPFLPDGLSFDPTTRTLSGMPPEAKSQATYTLSALDADGDVASLPFTLEVSLPSPDFNGDGNVNFADFLTFASKFGSRLGQERYAPRCDLNGDGQIDFDDFLIFADSFGSSG